MRRRAFLGIMAALPFLAQESKALPYTPQAELEEVQTKAINAFTQVVIEEYDDATVYWYLLNDNNYKRVMVTK